MPAINFNKQFESAIINRTKTQTIRANGKREIKPGQTLYLYIGLRTKKARKIREVKCTNVAKVNIIETGLLIQSINANKNFARYINSPDMLNAFAKLDGFNDWAELVQWFDKTHGLPFSGVIISWT